MDLLSGKSPDGFHGLRWNMLVSSGLHRTPPGIKMLIWPLSHQDIPGFESGGFQWNPLDSGSFWRNMWGSVQSSEKGKKENTFFDEILCMTMQSPSHRLWWWMPSSVKVDKTKLEIKIKDLGLLTSEQRSTESFRPILFVSWRPLSRLLC